MSDESKRELTALVTELGEILGRLNDAANAVRALGYPRERERELLKGIGFAMTQLDSRTLTPILREHPDLVPHANEGPDTPHD